MTSVFDLYFGSNNLKELTSDTFTGWKNVSLPKSIRTLNLQYNGITTIAPKSLDTLKAPVKKSLGHQVQNPD